MDVSIFGGCLRSDVPLRALPAGDGDPHWRLRRMHGAPPAAVLEPLGEDLVDPAVRVRLFRRADGYRLVYDDTGTFDVLDDGTRIDWYPLPNAPVESVRLDVLGRVLPTALHASGTICLHGSAVEIGGRGVAFLAPKRCGKSTLAQAVARAGGQVMSDDVVAVDVEPVPAMRAGVRGVRLWGDSAARLDGASRGEVDAFGKIVVRPSPGAALAGERVPVGAIYLLTPVAPDGQRAAAVRTALSPVHAAMALVSQARLAPLLGKGEGGALLDRAVRLARAAPVYTLEIVRDLERLSEAAEIVRSWHLHGTSGAPRAAIGAREGLARVG